MKNKSQVSMFMLLGILLMFVIGVGYYFVKNIEKEKISEKQQIASLEASASPVKIYIEKCFKDSSIKSAYKLGLHGGYYKLPKGVLDTNYTIIPFYYYKGQNLMPTKESIESELSDSISSEVKNCLNLSIFNEQGFKISEGGQLSIKVSASDIKTAINFDYPLTIENNGVAQKVGKFSYEVPIRLGYMHDISAELVNKIVQEPGYIDLTYLLSKDLDISIIHFDDCNDIYVVVDNYSKSINNYLYLFAAKFDEKDCKLEINETGKEISKVEIENYPPVLDDLPYMTAIVNENFAYNVTASDIDNDILFFLDDSDLFMIHPLTGTIKFTPKPSQEGVYKINITVVDIKGAHDTKWFYLEIK